MECAPIKRKLVSLPMTISEVEFRNARSIGSCYVRLKMFTSFPLSTNQEMSFLRR
jgi:hypothetical protein